MKAAGNAQVVTPADRALTALFEKRSAEALGWAIRVVEQEGSRPAGFYVMGRAAAALGDVALGERALVASARAASSRGNVALAMVCALTLRELGIADAELAAEIASTFAAESPRLLAETQKPPTLPPPQPREITPPKGDDASLLRRARELLDELEPRLTTDGQVAPHPLFSTLDEASLRGLLELLEVLELPQGGRLIEQGTTGAEAFILARGELEVLRESSGQAPLRLARLGHGALIGEMALLSRAPRAASVVACRPSVVLVARKDALEQVAGKQPRIAVAFAEHCRRRMLENLFRTSSILSAVSPGERRGLIAQFVTKTYEAGERLIAQGQSSEGLHVIASGEVSVVHREGEEATVLASLGPGEVVGEVALVLRRPSNADVVANHPTLTLHLPREGFLTVIREHPALFSQLYELAVKRDEETTSLVAQEAAAADDVVLV